MSIEFKGMEDVLGMIDKIASPERLEQSLTKACLLVERSAKQKAPKGSGDLRRSITHKVEGLTGTVYTPLEYAPYVEFGTGIFAENGGGRTDVPWTYYDLKTNSYITTSGSHPHPYMRPALDENREDIITLLWEGLTSD